MQSEENVMKERTCAACDCALDANAIRVTIGGKTVEVCCEECAQKLREAIAGFDAPRRA
jgi:RNase P subunit RPR2